MRNAELAGKLKILVVEDEAWSVMMITKFLNHLGYDCGKSVANGEEAVKVALEESPDVIFMDIRLADNVNGIEAAKRILSKKKIPIAFMTAYSDDEIIDEARKLDCAAYFIKPIDPLELAELLNSIAGGAK